MPNHTNSPQGVELMYERKKISNSMKSSWKSNNIGINFIGHQPIVGKHVEDMKNIRIMPKTIVHKNTDGKLLV